MRSCYQVMSTRARSHRLHSSPTIDNSKRRRTTRATAVAPRSWVSNGSLDCNYTMNLCSVCWGWRDHIKRYRLRIKRREKKNDDSKRRPSNGRPSYNARGQDDDLTAKRGKLPTDVGHRSTARLCALLLDQTSSTDVVVTKETKCACNCWSCHQFILKQMLLDR